MFIYSLLLILIGVLQYTPWFIYSYIAFFLLIFVTYVYFIFVKRELFLLNSLWLPIFLVIFWISSILAIVLVTGIYSINIINLCTTITIILLYSVIYSNIEVANIKKIYTYFIKIGFYIGVSLLLGKLFSKFEIINENSITILLFPYLLYLLLQTKNSKLIKILIYFIGIFLFYLSNGRTMLIIYILFPLLYFIAKSRIASILFLSICVIFSVISPIYFEDLLLEFNGVLSLRPALWIAYLNDYLINPAYYLLGSNEFVLPNAISQEEGWSMLHSHNTYIHTLWTEGLVKLIFIVIPFGVFALMKNNIKETIFLRVLLLSIVFMQVVEFVEITGISYLSIVYLMTIYIILVESSKKFGNSKV